MTGAADRIARRALSALLCFGALAGCAKDTEAAFREEVSAWLALGDTLHFQSTRFCTAAVFEARSGQISSAMRNATSWREASRRLDSNRPVAFGESQLSPSDLTGSIMDEDSSVGSRVISAGLALRDCLDDANQGAYHAALQEVDATLMFDPATQTLGILTGDRDTLFIGRGELR